LQQQAFTEDLPSVANFTDRTIDMNLFKTFSLTWWQPAFFKAGLLTTGIVIGTYWSAVFAGYVVGPIVVAAICLTYVTFVWAKQ
jgi:hypothetical protein